MTRLDKETVQQAIDEAFQQIQGVEDAELIADRWHFLHHLFQQLQTSPIGQDAVDHPGTRQAADFLAMETMLLQAMQHLTALQLSISDEKITPPGLHHA